MAKQDLSSFSTIHRANRLGIRLELFILIVLAICYISQGAKNSISTVGLVVILVTMWLPYICALVMYRRDPESGLVKHFIGIGYGLFYIAVCIFSDQQLVFTYSFPMLLAVAIYCDKKFSILVSICIMVIATIHAVAFTIRAGGVAVALAAMEIEIAATYFVCIYAIISNTFVIRIMDGHVKTAQETQEKTETMLESIMEVSNSLAAQVEGVSNKMSELAESSESTLDAMNEVTQGTGDTADSVQNQLVKTEEIQNQISRVAEASGSIGDSVEDSVAAIREGRQNVDNLMQQAQVSETAGSEAVKEVEALKEYTAKMEDIVSLIQSVASQTSLLSLNASIEAARAGDAGRGFAVVAGEISNLASQTESATENISELINNVTKKMDEVARAIASLVESNKIQNESAQVTAGSFARIAESTDVIEQNSRGLAAIVTTLDAANKEIIESIQTISAITEEVSAHSTTTCDKTEENMAIVDSVQDIVLKMTENAGRLKEIG